MSRRDLLYSFLTPNDYRRRRDIGYYNDYNDTHYNDIFNQYSYIDPTWTRRMSQRGERADPNYMTAKSFEREYRDEKAKTAHLGDLVNVKNSVIAEKNLKITENNSKIAAQNARLEAQSVEIEYLKKKLAKAEKNESVQETVPVEEEDESSEEIIIVKKI